MHVIYSSVIKGAGLHEGGPYASRFEGIEEFGGPPFRDPEMIEELIALA